MNSVSIDEESNMRQFVLTIKDIREEDYGNYTCHATNSLGMDRQEIIVSGKPLPPFIIPGIPASKTEYTLRYKNNNSIIFTIIFTRWRVESAFPVKEHNIYYERIMGRKV